MQKVHVARDFYFLLKACVHTKKLQVTCGDIPRYTTRKHCINSIYNIIIFLQQ